ncbi:MAG: heme-binding protein [Methylocystis sp.]
MQKGILYILAAFVVLILLAASLAGPVMSAVEKPKYTLADRIEEVEIRDYPPMIVAEVEVAGERKAAISQGFKRIANYIFGDNSPRRKIEMTAPVTQQASGEKIAMTAPVMQEAGTDLWKVRFVMPASYRLETLPTPNDKGVTLIALPPQRYAALTFSGLATEDSIASHKRVLFDTLAKHGVSPQGEAVLAFYNPPWTLPFLRRNEILIKIAS